MRLRHSLALAFLLINLNGNLNAQESKPPAPSPRIDSQPQKPHSPKTNAASQQDQQGTKERPFVIEIIRPPSAAPHTDNNTQESNPKPSSKSAIETWTAVNAIAAIVVALFTGCLWWTSRRQWEATSMAANAALRTATSLTTAERAYVFVNVKPAPKDFTEQIPPEIIANCCNHGKTPAKIGSIHCKPDIVPAIPLTLPTMLEEELPEGLVIASEAVYGVTVRWRDPIPTDQIEKIMRGDKFLVSYGFIRYYDIFDAEWETGFCWQYEPAIKRFKISASPLNYCKKAE
jgi:hypothetical protein